MLRNTTRLGERHQGAAYAFNSTENLWGGYTDVGIKKIKQGVHILPVSLAEKVMNNLPAYQGARAAPETVREKAGL